MVFAISFVNFSRFVSELAKTAEVFGPVKREVASYEQIHDASELFFDSLPEYTAKGLFFRPGEVILSYRNGRAMPPKFLKEKQPRRVLMGLRLCDLAAIRKQDLAFGSAPADPYYFRRREGILLFGYHQKQCGDQWCFCQSVDMEVSFDLMFYRRYDHYLVETGSDIGKGIIAEFRQFFDESSYVMTADDRRIENQLKLTDKEIAGLYANHGWEKLADRCVSCGVCNALCPTCYCFEFRDRTTADGTHKRVREHSECQLACFTSVAGGHTFRLEKTDRFKHRIYHQLQYFREKFRKTLCVGCGRCIRHCPTRIDFVTGINEMKEQQA